jgi:hypothetical protein
VNVLTRLANFTTPRGWVLIVLTAVGGYLTLGILGGFAFTLGAAAGLSASEWEEEFDDGRGTPPSRDTSWDSRPGDGPLSWRGGSNRTLHFTSLHHPVLALRAPALS